MSITNRISKLQAGIVIKNLLKGNEVANLKEAVEVKIVGLVYLIIHFIKIILMLEID